MPLTSAAPRVSIIIINWNSKDYLKQCLTSLGRYCSRSDLEVIVVDGASFDGCAEMLARDFPDVIFIQSEKNVGFAKANNLGARSARGSYLLLLNPDTEFIEDSISALLNGQNALPNAGAVGCMLLNSDKTLQTSCVQAYPTVLNQIFDSEYLRQLFPSSRLWGTAPLYANPPKPAMVEVISGACILIRRDLFEKVGGFSENYFMYGEDVDLCFKIKKAGFLVYYFPGTQLLHHGGTSSSKAPSNFSNIMIRHSVWLYLSLNRSALSACFYRLSMTLSALVRLLAMNTLMLFSKHVVRHGANSRQKWWAILRWSLGLESWTTRY